ncbi:MAG: hypothetical protein ACK56W_07630 [Pirellula sp.]|jgi:hypothetical protein
MMNSTSAAFVSRSSPGDLHRISSKLRTTDRPVQDVFAAVLEQVGRRGFASAEPLPESVSLLEEVKSSWDQWFSEFSFTRYTFIAGSGSPSVRENKTAEDLRTDYQQILVNAYENGGYASPESFLKKLSSEELATIQQVHHLADPIRTDSLSSEAALNLLLPPDAQVDENRDGLTAVGAAYTIRFPDSNTPTNVRMAWEATTEDMPEQDRMLHVMQLSSQILMANMHFHENGQYLGSSEPGDADWVNPQLSPDFSFKNQAIEWLEYLNRFSAQMPPEQYQRDTKFWSSFRDNLNLYGE